MPLSVSLIILLTGKVIIVRFQKLISPFTISIQFAPEQNWTDLLHLPHLSGFGKLCGKTSIESNKTKCDIQKFLYHQGLARVCE